MVSCLMDSQDAARAIQMAMIRLSTGKEASEVVESEVVENAVTIA
jgi:uncharacterized HAD superfamily protein